MADTTDGAQIRAELAAMVGGLAQHHREELNGRQPHHPEQMDHSSECFAQKRTA